MTGSLREELAAAIKLNFRDLLQARYYMAALFAITESGELTHVNLPSFYSLAYEAMVRSVELICMRTLDRRTQAGFEWILTQSPEVAACLSSNEKLELEELRKTARQLEHPRDKVVAHIDLKELAHQEAVYKGAPAWSEIRDAVETALSLLAKISSVHVSEVNLLNECTVPYDGSDGVTLLRYANRNDLHWHQKSENPEWFDQMFIKSMPHSG